MNIINNAKLCLYINGFTIKYTCWYVEILLEKNRDIAAQEKRGEEMDSYKKERSSKQHLKIDKERESLLLANPMACEVSPNSTLAESPSASLTTSVSIGQISRSSERSSFKGKSRSKSPSLFKFFQRGGGNRKVSAEEPEEDDYASSSSDHEDPFSPHASHSTHHTDITPQQNSRRTESPKSSSSSIEHYVTLPRKHKRKTQGQRDSGFSSERDSISQVKEDKDTLLNSVSIIDAPPLSPVDDYKPGGMPALEMLHNQLQILVKQECCEDVDSDSSTVYDQVIASLSRQLEDMGSSLDCLRQSDHNLRLSLRLAEQRAMEAETKLSHSQDRCQRVEQRYMKLAAKYQSLARRHRELERIQQKSAVLQQIERASGNSRNGKLPQRVHSQNQYDRKQKQTSEPLNLQRPSTAQGMHPTPPPPSLSHTETCV